MCSGKLYSSYRLMSVFFIVEEVAGTQTSKLKVEVLQQDTSFTCKIVSKSFPDSPQSQETVQAKVFRKFKESHHVEVVS